MNLTVVHGAAQRGAARAWPQPDDTGDDRAVVAPLAQASLLARLLADALLVNVQHTASLNVAAARSLLAHARIEPPPALAARSEAWRWSWRSFEVCATSADQMLNLTRGHVERSTATLWRSAERLFDELAQLQAEQVASLRDAFDAMRDAQAAYWRATEHAHGELVALAREQHHG